MDVHLDIDELVLDGFSPEESDLIRQAVQAGLGQLFSERGVPPGLLSGGAYPRLDGGSFNLAPGAAPEATGLQVAQAIYHGLSA
jgi:hypothetical protein